MANTLLVVASSQGRRSLLARCVSSRNDNHVDAIASVSELTAPSQWPQPPYSAVIVDHEEPFFERLQVLQDIRQLLPGVPVIISGVTPEAEQASIILRYFEYGAAGYVTTADACDRHLEVLSEVTRGESFVDPPVALELLQRLVELRQRLNRVDPYVFDEEPGELTPRQEEVLGLVAHGFTNQEIAEHLSISVGTVKNHVHGILESLRVSSRDDAARLFKSGTYDTVSAI